MSWQIGFWEEKKKRIMNKKQYHWQTPYQSLQKDRSLNGLMTFSYYFLGRFLLRDRYPPLFFQNLIQRGAGEKFTYYPLAQNVFEDSVLRNFPGRYSNYFKKAKTKKQRSIHVCELLLLYLVFLEYVVWLLAHVYLFEK